MNAIQLLNYYERVADAPEAVPRLRRFILNLAVRGKLVLQDQNDEPAAELLERIAAEKTRMIKSGELRKKSKLPALEPEELPFDIPHSWKWSRIREITGDRGQTVPDRDFTYIDVTSINKEVGCIEAAKTISAGQAPSRARKIVRKGDVVYSCVRPYLLNVAVVEREMSPAPIASTAFAVLNGFGLVDPRFQWIVLRSPFMVSCVQEGMRGQAYPAINESDFACLPFPLPPLAEQHRIVAKVDQLMALCDRLAAAREAREATRDRLTAASLTSLSEPDLDERLFRQYAGFAFDTLGVLTSRSDQIKQLRQTILDLAVRGKLVPQDPNNEPASELLNRIAVEKASVEKKGSKNVEQPHLFGADGSILYDLPEGWAWSDAKNLAQPNELITYGILKPVWVDTGVPTVRVTEMKTGTIDVGTLRRCDPARARKFSKTTLASGDLLISKDGTIGKTAFVPEELAGGNVTQHILRFAISRWVYRRFVKLVIDAPFSQEWMRDETKGVALKGVNVADFRRMPIPVPPMEEQHRIVAKVDELMALCARLETSLDQSTATRSRLLDSLLHVAVAAESRKLEAAE